MAKARKLPLKCLSEPKMAASLVRAVQWRGSQSLHPCRPGQGTRYVTLQNRSLHVINRNQGHIGRLNVAELTSRPISRILMTSEPSIAGRVRSQNCCLTQLACLGSYPKRGKLPVFTDPGHNTTIHRTIQVPQRHLAETPLRAWHQNFMPRQNFANIWASEV